MARKTRPNIVGFHHIVNTGVAKSRVYKSNEDKEQYLNLLCKACLTYQVNIHDYCLMNNHYHLLIETTQENLSLFMRQVNSNYAIYFNRKYKRVGHLWQGRYKSWYMAEETHLYDLFRFIEHIPTKARISKQVGEYPFTLLASVLNDNQEVIPCAKNSKILKEINYEGMRERLELALSKKELKNLQSLQKRKIVVEENSYKYINNKTLKEYFKNYKSKKERNIIILEALKDSYTQAQIARHLKLSCSIISKIKKKFDE